MTSLTQQTCPLAPAASSRRRLMQALTVGALGAPLSTRFDIEAEARKRRRKSRRKKKRNPQLPEPQVRADAACPLPQNQIFVVGSLARLAQSFTAGTTGELVRVNLALANPNGGSNNYLLRVASLVDGLPGADVLATAQVNASSAQAGVTEVTFSFASPAGVVAGTSYALVLAVDGIDNFSWVSRSGATCAGRAFLADGLSAPFEPRNDQDFVFTTFVRVAK